MDDVVKGFRLVGRVTYAMRIAYDRGCIVNDAIIRHLEHKVDECLHFDNKQLRDPHANDPKF